MLVKNVYLLYPAGYSGNYVNWAICRSDRDLADSTTPDPVNLHATVGLGGVGTSHGHQRLPTHMAINDLLIWIAYNRPQIPQTYVVFTTNETLPWTIDSLCRIDPDPIFIIIHDNDDLDIRVYGHLNAILKWPTYFHMKQTLINFRKQQNNQTDTTDYDFFVAANDRKIRNAIAENKIPWFCYQSPIKDKLEQECRWAIQRSRLWFDTRHSLQPHELPSNMHLVLSDLPSSNIFQINCRDIAGTNFLDFLEFFMINSGCSDQWDTKAVEIYHDHYIEAQINLEWFTAMTIWRHKESAQITPFLTSNQCVEGFVIREILHRIGHHSDPKTVLKGWENQDLETINSRYIQQQLQTCNRIAG